MKNNRLNCLIVEKKNSSIVEKSSGTKPKAFGTNFENTSVKSVNCLRYFQFLEKSSKHYKN